MRMSRAFARRALSFDWSLATCRKLKVRPKVSWASSPAMMAMASETAEISAARVFWRSCHSASETEQRLFSRQGSRRILQILLRLRLLGVGLRKELLLAADEVKARLDLLSLCGLQLRKRFLGFALVGGHLR